MKLTFTNNFHNSSANVRADVIDGEAWLTPSQVKRVGKKLCGVNGCACGYTELNYRGDQEYNIETLQDFNGKSYARIFNIKGGN